MSAVDDVLAGEVYSAAVAPSERRGARRAGAALAGLLSAALGDGGEVTSAGDVVVRRRSDQVEVLRVRGGPSEELAWTLQSMQEQLDHLSLRAFHEAWGLE